MIVGSLLLILVAVALLVAGVLSGSNALIVCAIVIVVLAAIVLVIGVKQTAAANEELLDEDDEDVTGEYPAVGDNGFRSRQSTSRQSDLRTADESVPVRSRRGTTVATERTPLLVDDAPGRGATYVNSSSTIPSQGTVEGRDRFETPYENAQYETSTYGSEGGFASGGVGGPGNGAPAVVDDVDGADDPPDEPSAQIVSPSNAARVAMLTSEVLVIDGRPRYHVTGCVHLLGRESEALPVGEAVELGFTPCGLCEPDSALLAEARRV